MSTRLHNRLALTHLAATMVALVVMAIALWEESTSLFAVSWLIYGITSVAIGVLGIRHWRAAIQNPRRTHTPSRLDATVRVVVGCVLIVFAVVLIIVQST